MFVVFMVQKIKTTKYGLEKWGVGNSFELRTGIHVRENKKTYKGNRNSIEIDDVRIYGYGCRNSHSLIPSLIFKFQKNVYGDLRLSCTKDMVMLFHLLWNRLWIKHVIK